MSFINFVDDNQGQLCSMRLGLEEPQFYRVSQGKIFGDSPFLEKFAQILLKGYPVSCMGNLL